jgi:hypothetical protein
MPLEILDPLFRDPRFTSADGRKKAEARQKLWGGYLLADPAAAARFQELDDTQRKQVVDQFYQAADERWGDAFTIEVSPQRLEKRTREVPIEQGVAPVTEEYDAIVPAVRRKVHDLATEDFISQVKDGKITPDKFSQDELLATAPVILEAAPDKVPLWQARAKDVAVDKGLLPADGTWQQSAARAIGTLGGAIGPAVAGADWTSKELGLAKDDGTHSLERGPLRAMVPQNRALVALAYPDANAFKTAGTLLSLGGISAKFGAGLTRAGIEALSRKGIALQVGADAALGFAYRHEAPGILASALDKPDDGALNAIEAGAISGLFGVTLRAIDHTFTLKGLREQVGFGGSMDEFREYLRRQRETLAPAPDSAPNTRPRGPLEPAEEGAAIPEVLPEELQPIAMPKVEDPALADKARAAAGKAAINGPALERLQDWPADPELKALVQSDASADDIADAVVRQEPGQPLPIEIRDGGQVIGGSIPEQLPAAQAAEGELFGEMPFNLASEVRPDADKLTAAAFDRAAEAQKQGKLIDVPAELPPGSGLRGPEGEMQSLESTTPPAKRPAAPDTGSLPDSAAGVTGGRTDATQGATAVEKVKKGRSPRLGSAPDGEMDLLSHIEELGGIAGPGKNAGGEYDGFAETFNRGPARLLRRRGASSVDQLMGELADRGFKFETADQFYQAVSDAVTTRTKTAKALAAETHEGKFGAAFFENAGRPGPQKAPRALASDDLKAGTTFKVNGEPWKATEIHPDNGKVKIEGAGRSRWIEPGTPIFPDAGVLKQPKSVRAAGDPFSVEQATLPRRISAPLVTPDAGPVTLAGIREYLGKALDIPVRLGVNRRRAWGFFRTKEEAIRLKLLNDIPTLAHEVGHYLHKIVFPGGGTGSSHGVYSTFAKKFDTELMQLGRATSRKSYSVQQVRMEGVAEFVREYMTDRSGAMAVAPQFTAHFEQTLQGGFPEIWKIVSKAREDLGRYINQTPAMKVRAMISRAPAASELSAGQRLEKFYSDWVSELRPIERNLELLVQHGLPADRAAGVSAAATNYVGGWRGKVEHDLFKAQTNLAGHKVGESLRDILGGLDDNARMELGDYMVAKRAIELGKRGIKSGISTPDAAATARLYQGRYERTRVKLLGFQQRNLQLLEQSGFFTADQLKKMGELNQDYTPFYRVYESAAGVGRPGGRGFANVPAGVRKIKGSDRMIVDPLESIVRNAEMFRDLAERNFIGRKFVAAVEETAGGGRVADRVVKRIAPVNIRHDEIVEQMVNAGVPNELIDAMEEEAGSLGMTLWKAVRTEDPRKGIFKVWKNGKEVFYQTDDQELMRSLLMMDRSDAEVMARFPFVQSVLRPITRIKRAGATLAVEFIARNPFRDQIQAGVYSQHGFVPFFDGFHGILSALKKDQYYWDWVKSGGRYSDFIAADRADLVKSLKNVTAKPDVVQFIKENANPLNVLHTLQKVSELMEMGTRIGEFRRAIRAGVSPVEAANASKDISLNFARAGFKGKVWNQLQAFYNAGVQDVDKLVRAHIQNPARTAAKAMAYITLPSIGAWYLGKDDPEIKRLPEWRKTLFWNFNVTDVFEAAGIPLQAPLVVSLPKPFLLGHLYGTSVEKGLDYAYAKDPNAVKEWFADLYSQTPLTPARFVPDAGLPLIENLTNYSFFRQAPIVSQAQQGLPAEFQATPQTSQVAQLIGKTTGTSPLMIDNAVRGYFAGLGKYGTDGIDWFLTKTNLRDAPEAPTKMFRELPGVRAFVGSPYAAGAELEQFYTGLDLAEKRLRAFSYFGKEISNDSEKAWWNKNRNEVVYYDQKRGDATVMTEVRRIQKSLSDLSKAMVQVQESRGLTPESKRTTLLELRRQRDQLAAAGVKLLHPTDQRDAK